MLGKLKIDYCKDCDCGEKKPIVNKTRHLCQEKNTERLVTQDKPKRQAALLKSSGLKISSFKQKASKSGGLKLSKKKEGVNRQYKLVCTKISEERGMVCQGCGTSDRLSFSHLIPRSRRPDLITIALNIHIHCMDGDGIKGCHEKCEAGRYDELQDGEDIKRALVRLDSEYFSLKLMKR
jgi:hypothetical protein